MKSHSLGAMLLASAAPRQASLPRVLEIASACIEFIHSVSFYSARLIDPILRTLLCGVLCVSAGFDLVIWPRCLAAADVVSSLLAQGLCYVIYLPTRT